MSGAWRAVAEAKGPRTGRGSFLGPDTWRRGHWWDLSLDCGHFVQRAVRYGPHRDGYPRQRGGSQRRDRGDVLPAPKRVQCEFCPVVKAGDPE